MSPRYEDITKQEAEAEEYLLGDESQPRARDAAAVSYRRWIPSTSNVILSLLLLVVSAGWILEATQQHRLASKHRSAVSENAGLMRDVDIALVNGGKWVNNDPEVEDAVWASEDLDFWQGVVAVSDDWARDRGLPLSQRWPWDAKKGIYLLASTHHIHCLKTSREIILGAYEGKQPLVPRAHIKHCLGLLMQDALCHADDTLFYTGRIYANENVTLPSTGIGQSRKCRDWSKLREWATSNSACYNTTVTHHEPVKDWYKDCPDGSRPWENVE